MFRVLLLAGVFSLYLTLTSNKSHAQPNSVTDICALYKGSAIGYYEGKPVNLTCEVVQEGFSEVSRTMSQPPFRAMWLLLRDLGSRKFSDLLVQDPDIAGQCRRDR